MEGRARVRWVGAALALGLVSLPCFAGAQGSSQTTTTTTTNGNQVTTVQTTTVSADMAAPVIPEANRVKALAAINAAGITGDDIAKVMGLMEDLRDAESIARAKAVDVESTLLTSSGAGASPADQALSQAQQDYLSRVQSIWSTVADRIGQDKANALRRIVEPTVDTRPWAQTDEHMIAINQLLNQFDQEIAAGPGGTTVAQSTTTTTEATPPTTTTTTTTVTTQPGLAHRTDLTGVFVSTLPVSGSYTIVSEPFVSQTELVDLLHEKFMAMNTTPETQYLLLESRRDVTSPDLKYAWEKMLHVWD